MAESIETHEPIKLIKISKKSEIPELPDTERMTCECGMNILTRRYKAHCSNYQHKYHVGKITKEQYDEYDTKYKNRYRNLGEEKLEELRKKSREYQRERSLATNGAYYAEKRLDYITCECGNRINKTYSKSHFKSAKHIHGIAGTIAPKRTIVRKKIDIMETMQAMIAE